MKNFVYLLLAAAMLGGCLLKSTAVKRQNIAVSAAYEDMRQSCFAGLKLVAAGCDKKLAECKAEQKK